MATLLLAISVTLISVAGLALGVMLGRKPIKGSCGGLSCHTCKTAKLKP